MKPGIIILYLALFSFLPGNVATAQTVALPTSADRCAISYALTGQTIAGCTAPRFDTQTFRSVAPRTKGYFVNFEINSNALSGEAIAHLERLSSLLTGPLSHLCIKMIGHTDTTGPSGHNLTLSKKRAKAVHLYMAGPGHVGLQRLSSEGHGETRPLPGKVGSDPENRRVEILAKESTAGHCP